MNKEQLRNARINCNEWYGIWQRAEKNLHVAKVNGRDARAISKLSDAAATAKGWYDASYLQLAAMQQLAIEGGLM